MRLCHICIDASAKRPSLNSRNTQDRPLRERVMRGPSASCSAQRAVGLLPVTSRIARLPHRYLIPEKSFTPRHLSLRTSLCLPLTPCRYHRSICTHLSCLRPRSFAFLTLHLGTGQSHLRLADGGLACAGLVCPVLELAERLPAGPSARSVFLRTSWRISPNPPYHLARYSAHRMDLINRVE